MTIPQRDLWCAVAACVALAPVHAMSAEKLTYLPPQSAASVLADGKSWSAQAVNGRTFKLTLTQDGAGAINGPLNFKLSLKWAIKGDTLCLSGTMISKCLRFQEIPGGLQGWNGDERDLKLTR